MHWHVDEGTSLEQLGAYTRCTIPAMTTTQLPPLDTVSLNLLTLMDQADPAVAQVLRNEAIRQAETLELIASENHVSPAVMHAKGTWMTNKYADAVPYTPLKPPTTNPL